MPQNVPLRIVLGYQGIVRKFLSLFIGRDNSFYFHPYRPPGELWWQPPPHSERVGEHLRLHFPLFTPSAFNLHKVSFHPSGYIHLTDKSGNRRRDGVRGPAFSELTLPYDFAVFVPCDPKRLPEHRHRRGFVAEIALPEDVRPFYVTFSIVNAANPPQAQPGPYIPHPLNFFFPGKTLGVALTMWPVRGANGYERSEWPTFPFFLLRTSA